MSEESSSEKNKNKLQKIDLYRCVVAVMAKKFIPAQWPPFPETFKVLHDEKGDIDYCEISKDDVVRFVSKNRVTDCMMRYIEEDCFHIGNTFAKVSDLTEILKRLHIPSMNLDLGAVAPVRQLSEPGLTFHRLPWDLTPGEFPTFREFLFRTSNAAALMAWIGSLLDPKSDRQQYCWLFGAGRNGKGSLARVLQKIFGKSFATEQPPPRDDRFWTSGLLGKRLVVFPDCNHYGFPTTGLFKSLTGGDRVRIERKGCQPFDAELNAKFMFLSNDRPKLSSQEADMRRAIFCDISPIDTDFGPNYEETLWSEAPHFLHHCMATYKELCVDGNKREIPIDRSVVEGIADMAESDYQVIFDKYFIKADEDEKHRLMRDRSFVSLAKMKKILDTELGDHSSKRYFRDWMARVYGVTYQKLRVTEGRSNQTFERRWVGIRETSAIDQALDGTNL